MIDSYVKSPYAAFRFLLPLDKLGTGLFPVTVSLSDHARLASGAFSEIVPQTWLWRLIARTA
jgi:hypothetical protein